jgi:hypothetical protein
MVTLQRRMQILEGRLKKAWQAHKQAIQEINQREAVIKILSDQIERSAMMHRDFDRLVSLAAHGSYLAQMYPERRVAEISLLSAGEAVALRAGRPT